MTAQQPTYRFTIGPRTQQSVTHLVHSEVDVREGNLVLLLWRELDAAPIAMLRFGSMAQLVRPDGSAFPEGA